MRQVGESPMACPVSGGGQIAATVPRSGRSHTATSYMDAVDVLRNPKLLALIHDGTEQFRGGTVRQIDGPVHKHRRRTMGTLLRGEGDDWFRNTVLLPTIARNLDAVLATRSADGLARADMVVFVRRAFFQLAASLIGLQGVDDLDFAEHLRVFCDPINKAMRSWYESGDRDAIMARGISVMEEFRKRYFEPAYEHHEELVAQVNRGERSADELPHDLLTLVAKGEDPELASDRSLALREAVTDMINAGTFSSAFTLLHSLAEMLGWFNDHPEDGHRRLDPEFLYGGVAEALRLHPVVPMLWRLAEEDVTLTSGMRFQRGDVIAVDVRSANRDGDTFGLDANTFDPRRPATPGVNAYGLTFGTGRHMCFGLPLILGSLGSNGSHVQMLRSMFEADIALDPDDLPVPPAGELALWDRFPVVFGCRGD
jgi:cytochrome P450